MQLQLQLSILLLRHCESQSYSPSFPFTLLQSFILTCCESFYLGIVGVISILLHFTSLCCSQSYSQDVNPFTQALWESVLFSFISLNFVAVIHTLKLWILLLRHCGSQLYSPSFHFTLWNFVAVSHILKMWILFTQALWESALFSFISFHAQGVKPWTRLCATQS